MTSTRSEIVSRRVFPAPPGRLFDAVADPSVLARWWGPAGSVNVFEEFDFRPGGAWRFVMRAADGTEFPMSKRFVEIDRPERIVLDHLDPVHGFRMSMAIADAGAGRARLEWRMAFDSAAEADRVRTFVLAANEENFDRLEAVLREAGAAA